jgi:CheY-like chemotaxis protein
MSPTKAAIGRWVGLLVLTVSCTLTAAHAPVFTTEEQQWIKSHPVAHFAVDEEVPPLFYTKDGVPTGLVADYLAAISRESGLRFERYPSLMRTEIENALLGGKVDILPIADAAEIPPPLSDKLLYTEPYVTSPRLIITRADESVMLNANELNGKVVSMHDSATARVMMLARWPKATPLFTLTVADALDAVEDRRAYASIGADVMLAPLLRHKYRGLLSISGPIPDAPLKLDMAVRKDEPLLFSIVKKSLENLPSQEADAMREQAVEQASYDASGPRPLARHHVLTIISLALGLGLLAFFAWRVSTIKKTTQAPMTPRAASETPATAHPRVLVVEDHPQHRSALIEQLNVLGVASVGFRDGIEALADVERQLPALILMDCDMPGLDGYETTRRIRQREAEQGLPHVPIIAVSAASDAQHMKSCMDAGMDGVLKKPLRLEELQSTLQMWLDPLPHVAHEPVDAPAASLDIRALYQASMDEDMHAVEQAIQRRNAEELAHFAHRIKGAALMLGAHEAADAADQLEQEARSTNMPDVVQMERMLPLLKDAIARYFAPVDSQR